MPAKRCHIPEENIGSIHEASGFTFDLLYDLYFTTERVVVVMIQNPGDIIPSASWTTIFVTSPWTKHAEREKRDEMTASQHGWMRDLSPDDMLAKSNRNFQIKYSDIAAVELKRGLFQLKIKIKTNRNVVHNFSLDKERVKEVRQLLEKVFPTKLK